MKLTMPLCDAAQAVHGKLCVLGPLPLPAGSRREWRCSIDGETREDRRVAFSTRAPAAGA